MGLKLYSNFIGGAQGIGLLLLRVGMGTAFILHGWPKIQHPFVWMNEMGGTAVPGFLQAIAAFTEFGGGIALILGLLTPIASLLLVCQMLAALFMVHFPAGHPFVAAKPEQPSFESALIYLLIAMAILVLGPGYVSVDNLIFGRSRVPRHAKLTERFSN